MQNEARLISLNEACELTSLSRTFINRLHDADKFPRKIPLGDRRFAFAREDVLNWIGARIQDAGATGKSQQT